VPSSTSSIEVAPLRHGLYSSCGLTSAGQLYCWGYNNDYQLGDGSKLSHAHAVRPLGDEVVKRFGIGVSFACAVTDDDTTYCWGDNEDGQADRSAKGVDVPYPSVRFEAADSVPVSFAFGETHACALDHEGRAHCWGANDYLQLGRTTAEAWSDIGEVEGDLRFTQLVSGAEHVCGLATDGKVHCWGHNDRGQLGTGEYSEPRLPTVVVGQ